MQTDSPTLALWLVEWRNGDQEAANRLFARAYDELRRLLAAAVGIGIQASPEYDRLR